MANRTVELEIALKNAKSISDLELVLKDINKDLKDTDTNSAAFQKLSSLSKEANKSLGDVKESLKTISSERMTTATIKLGEGLVGGFALAQVASKQFSQKTQEDVQNVIAAGVQLQVILAGLKPIVESLNASNRAAFSAMITGFKESALGAQLFGTTTRAALTATGIGLFIVALGTIVAYWDDIKVAIMGAESEQEKYFKTQQAGIEASKVLIDDYNKSLEFQNQLLQIQGQKEGEILNNKRTELLTQISIQERQKKLAAEQLNLAIQELEQKREINKLFGFNQDWGLDELISKSAALKKQFDAAAKSSVDLKNALALIDAQGAKNNALAAKQYADEVKAFEARTKALLVSEDERFAKIMEDEVAQMQAEADLSNAEQDRITKENKAFDERRKNTQEQIDLEHELHLDVSNDEDELHAKRLAHLKEVTDNSVAFTQQFLDATNQVGQAINDALQRRIDAISTQVDYITSRFQESVQIRESLEAQLADSQGARHDQIVNQIDEEVKKEKDLADKKKKLQNDQIKQQNKLQESQWRLSLINATVNTALAVTQALNGPYPLSLIFAALAAVLGGVEIGVIASNKPEKIPTLARGGFTGAGSVRDETGERKTFVAQLHENEYVAPRWQVEHPVYGAMIQSLENARVNRSMASGGFMSAPVLSEQSFNSLSGDALVAAVQSANISVSVQEINTKQTNVKVLEANASL